MPVSTSSAKTCPTTCPFLKTTCYADSGPLALHWKKVTDDERGVDFDEFVEAISNLPEGQLWRHNQAGDLPGTGNRINTMQLARLVLANRGKRGFTYTHKPVLNNPSNREVVAAANRDGFTINLSANNPDNADDLYDLDIGPVTVVLPTDAPDVAYTPAGRKIVTCPAQTRENVNCMKCQICANSKRNYIVGFLAHGVRARKMSEMVRG